MENLPLAPWDLVWADVENYDRAHALASVADLLRGLEKKHGALVRPQAPTASGAAPGRVEWSGENRSTSGAVAEELSERLVALLPHWYGRSSWRVGNETFGGCWCCAFPAEISKGHDAGARWVVGELELMHDALRAWAPHVAKVDQWPVASTRSVVLGEAVDGLIEAMVENDWLSESWYAFVDDGARWLLNAATGVDPNDPLVSALESYSYGFSSWVKPASSKRSAFAEGVAALLAKLEARGG